MTSHKSVAALHLENETMGHLLCFLNSVLKLEYRSQAQRWPKVHSSLRQIFFFLDSRTKGAPAATNPKRMFRRYKHNTLRDNTKNALAHLK